MKITMRNGRVFCFILSASFSTKDWRMFQLNPLTGSWNNARRIMQNIKLLRALFNDVPFPDIPPLSSNSSRLLHSLIVRERIAYTPHQQLRTTFMEQNNIFHHYHQLYPPIGNDLSKAHKAELIGYIVPLFQSEI
eukprot:244079_1